MVRAASLPIRGPEIDGVLGVDWLKGQRLVLDFKSNKLEITKSKEDQRRRPRRGRAGARRNGQLTIVDADLSGKRISAIIDSGAETTLCNGRPAQAGARAGAASRLQGRAADDPHGVAGR
jgi:hypothetical protein